MQETAIKRSADSKLPVDGSVTLVIRSKQYRLNGQWSWEMESESIYASDVMNFPADFEGTKGIVHPDDLHNLTGAIELLADSEIAQLNFRLITTYGEVKAIAGQRVSLDGSEEKDAGAHEHAAWEETLQQMAAQREAEYLKQRTAIADFAEKIFSIGSWAINKSTAEAWYSDGVYHIHGLPPQSLNAHTNTFHPFLHPDDRLPFLDAFDTAYEAEVPVHLEYRIVPSGGSVTTVRLVTHWSYNSRGQAVFTGVLHNTSEEAALQQQATGAEGKAQLHQQVLRFSEQHWNTGYFFIDLDTRKATYSDNYYRIFGLKSQSLPESNAFINLVHPDDRLRVRRLMDKMFSEHQLPEAEFRILRQDGKQRTLKQSGKLLLSGTDLVMIGVVQDVTVPRGLERKVAELNEKLALQSVVQQLTEGITETGFLTWHPDGYIHWSEVFYRLLGYKAGSVEPSVALLHRQIHPHDLKAFKDAELLVTNGQNHADVRFRITNRGGTRQLSISFHRVSSGTRELVVGVVKDLTRDEALQQKLAETAAYGGLLGNTISDAVILTDRDNTVLHWNRAAEEKTNIPATEAIYGNLFDLFPALKEEGYIGRLQSVMTGRDLRELKARDAYLQKAHHYFLTPIKNEAGEVKRVLHVVQDVSKELELQQQLSERLNFIESLVDASVDRIVVLDKHMNYLYWNKRAEEYYAISREKVLGRNILEIFPGFRNDPGYGEFRKVLRGETIHIPAKVQEETGEYFETYLTPIKDEEGDVASVLWVVHDLTNEYRLLQQEQRAKAASEKEHRQLKEAQALGRVGSFEWEVGSYVSHWSDELYRIHGLEPQSEEITLDKVDRFSHPDDFKETMPLKQASLRKPGHYHAEHRIVLRNGQVRWVNHRWECIADREGKVIKVTGVVQDVTEQYQAKEQLKEQSHFLRRITETTPDMISVIELATGDTTFLNSEVFADNGFDPEKMLARTAEERAATIYPDDRPLLRNYFGKLAAASDDDTLTAEYRALTDAGEWRWFFVRGKVFQRNEEGKATHVLNVIENITKRKQAEQEVQKNITILQQAESLAQMGSWEYEIASGKFTWSEGMYRLFGLPQSRVVNPETYLDFVVAEDQFIAKRIIKSLRKTHRNFEEIVRIKKGSGTRLLKINATVVNENGKPQRVVGVDLDITDVTEAERKAAESQRWLIQTAEASPDAITVYDLKKKHPVYLNNCLPEWLGISAETLVDIGVDGRLQLIHPEDRLPLLHFLEKLKAVKEGEVLTLDYRVRRGNGQWFWIRNRGKVFQRDAAGQVTHVLSFLQDITQEKAAGQVLIDLNASLEKKNAELAEKNEEITSFAFVASHDLREPLRKIHTFSDWLLTREPSLSEQGKETLKRLASSVHRLGVLIDDILALTKVQVDKERPKEVDMNHLLLRLKEELQEKLQATGAVVEAGPLPKITGAENQLFYLLRNLLSNAIKFQPEGRTPRIQIRASNEDGYTKISVADNGIGIPAEHHKKIFEMFRRLHGRSEYEGTGMGLSICKKIMEKHGGKITVESEEGKGACFVCWFPAALSTN